jgi:hypothetical protein
VCAQRPLVVLGKVISRVGGAADKEARTVQAINIFPAALLFSFVYQFLCW